MSKPYIMEDFKNERNINVRYKFSGDEMHVLSQLTDDHHDIQLFFRIGKANRKILEVKGQMNLQPFPDCSGALEILENLKGLEINVGVKKNYRQRFEKKAGCTHITEIFMITIDFIFARLYGTEIVDNEAEKDRRRRIGAELLCQNESCHIFNRENLKEF
ncbi:MAG: DUF2889 domain-containing protein, partial [Deltaproteobacteria bacterium]|nr:DUF2889 domain-containing protein [Deltaproteobacteria bacterium]